MEINDDIAYVVVDVGHATLELIMVLNNGNWFIAGIKKGGSIHI